MTESLSTGDLNDHLWDEDGIQFARLIVELRAAGIFESQTVITLLCASMDLTAEEIRRIIERAKAEIDRVKVALS